MCFDILKNYPQFAKRHQHTQEKMSYEMKTGCSFLFTLIKQKREIAESLSPLHS